eukprot:gene7370-5186_t
MQSYCLASLFTLHDTEIIRLSETKSYGLAPALAQCRLLLFSFFLFSSLTRSRSLPTAIVQDPSQKEMKAVKGCVYRQPCRCPSSCGPLAVYTRDGNEGNSFFVAIATLMESQRHPSLTGPGVAGFQALQEGLKERDEQPPSHPSLGVVLSFFHCLVDWKATSSSVRGAGVSTTLLHRIPVAFPSLDTAEEANESREDQDTALVVDKMLWVSEATITVLSARGELCVLRTGLLPFPETVSDSSSSDSMEQHDDVYGRLEHVRDFAVCSLDAARSSKGIKRSIKDVVVAASSTQGLTIYVVEHQKSASGPITSQLCHPVQQFKEECYSCVSCAVLPHGEEATPPLLLVGCSQRSSTVITTRSSVDWSLLSRQELILGPHQRFLGASISSALHLGGDDVYLVALVGAEEDSAADGKAKAQPATLLGKDGTPLVVNVQESIVDILSQRCLNECYRPPPVRDAGRTTPCAEPAAPLTGLRSDTLLLSSLVVTQPDIRAAGTVDLLQWSVTSKKLLGRRHFSLSTLKPLLSCITSPYTLRVLPGLQCCSVQAPTRVYLSLFDGTAEGYVCLSLPTQGEQGNAGEICGRSCVDAVREKICPSRSTAFLGVAQPMLVEPSGNAQLVHVVLCGEPVPESSGDQLAHNGRESANEENTWGQTKSYALPKKRKVHVFDEARICFSSEAVGAEQCDWGLSLGSSQRAEVSPPLVAPSPLSSGLPAAVVASNTMEEMLRRIVREENQKLLQAYHPNGSVSTVLRNGMAQTEGGAGHRTLLALWSAFAHQAPLFSPASRSAFKGYLRTLLDTTQGSPLVGAVAQQLLTWSIVLEDVSSDSSGPLPSVLSLGEGLVDQNAMIRYEDGLVFHINKCSCTPSRGFSCLILVFTLYYVSLCFTSDSLVNGKMSYCIGSNSTRVSVPRQAFIPCVMAQHSRMRAMKLQEVSHCCAVASAICLEHAHYSTTAITDLRQLYTALSQLPSCISLLSAYEEGPTDDTNPNSRVLREVSDAVTRVLPFLSQHIAECGKTSASPAESANNLDPLINDGIPVPLHSTEAGGRDLLPRSSIAMCEENEERGERAGWDAVVGCEEAKTALKQCTVFPRKFPQLFKRRRPFQRVLLYGPPGTGKTLLAQAAAQENHQAFLSFSAADLLSKWVGESEKHIQELFMRASRESTAILFFDEIDALCSARGGSDESEASRRIKTQFLLQLQHMPPSVTVIAATNLPWEIDPAIRRRFDRTIYVDVPDDKVRRVLLLRSLRDARHVLSDGDIRDLIGFTSGFTASDVVLLAQQALSRPLGALADAESIRPATREEIAGISAVTDVVCDSAEVYFTPCLATDPRALHHVDPQHIPEGQLVVRCVTREDFDIALCNFVPSVTKESRLLFTHGRLWSFFTTSTISSLVIQLLLPVHFVPKTNNTKKQQLNLQDFIFKATVVCGTVSHTGITLHPSFLSSSLSFLLSIPFLSMFAGLHQTEFCFIMIFTIFLTIVGLVMLSNHVPIPLIDRLKGSFFNVLYRLYCSEMVGNRVLKKLMHPPSIIPHSDYRAGVRCLHPHHSLPKWRPIRKENRDPNLSAAQLGRLRRKSYYGVGGPIIDVRALHEMGEAVKSDGGVLIVPIPIFSDNYSYGIISLATEKMALVDPADGDTCLIYLKRFRSYTGLPHLQLTEVLTTHKHWDHAGGNKRILDYATSHENKDLQLVAENVVVLGSKVDSPHCCTRLLENGDVFDMLDGGAVAKVIPAPGHTAGSVLFCVADSTEHPADYLALFTGDAIFCGGCGNPFETASLEPVQKMRSSMFNDVCRHPKTGEKIQQDRVLLYVGHEYTTRLLQGHQHLMAETLKQMSDVYADEKKKVSTYVETLGIAYAEAKDLRRTPEEIDMETGKGATLPLCTPWNPLTVRESLGTHRFWNVCSILTPTDAHLKTKRDHGNPQNGDSIPVQIVEELEFSHVPWCTLMDRHGVHLMEGESGASMNEVEILPLGSGGEVGRSCVVLRFKGRSVMLDCGNHPAKSGLDSLPFFDSIRGEDIDVVLVTHFHLDHCGALPYFCNQTTFKGRIFMTSATKAFYKMVMNDFLRIGAGANDLITNEWLRNTLERIETIEYHEEITVNGITFQAFNAGHVLGAAMFMVNLAGMKALYTGDFSRVPDRHLLGAEIPPFSPDILIAESTNGVHELESREEREFKFTSNVKEVVTRGGRCLVPVFALGRAQELLLILEEFWEAHRELQTIPIYYASSLAQRCMKLYQTFVSAMNDRVKQQHDNHHNPFVFKYIRPLVDTKSFEDLGACVVLASPGMLQSGISLELFERWCKDPRNGIIMAGYCVDGTIAKQVLEKPKEVEKPDGRILSLRMRTITAVSFSAHSDGRQTRDFIQQLPNVRHTVLVHGNEGAMGQLKNKLQTDFKDRGMQVYTTQNQKAIRIPFVMQHTARVMGRLASHDVQAGEFVSGVMLVSGQHAYHIVHPSDVTTFTNLSVTRVQQALVLPLPHRKTPLEVLHVLQRYFGESKMYDNVQPRLETPAESDAAAAAAKEHEHEDREGAQAQPEVVVTKLLVAPGITVEVQQNTAEFTTTLNLTWMTSHYNDLLADVTCIALSKLAGETDESQEDSSLLPIDISAKDKFFRLKCFHHMISQFYRSVKTNLATGTTVILLDDGQTASIMDCIEVELEAKTKGGVPDYDSAEVKRLKTALKRIYLTLFPIPADNGWCDCGMSHDDGNPVHANHGFKDRNKKNYFLFLGLLIIKTKRLFRETKMKREVKNEKKVVKEEEESDNDEISSLQQEWWEQENLRIAQKGEKRWSTLCHNGVLFPPEYTPHGIPILYEGKPFQMTPEEEEVATMFAVMKDFDYYRSHIFRANFFRSWRKILDKRREPHPIKRLELCDFEAIYRWSQEQREKRLNRTKEEKKADKLKQDEEAEPYRWCLWDGRREQVANFRVEPPGLFRGRGQHPLQGTLKVRVRPEDITINIDSVSPIPEPPVGHKWANVIHDNTVTWLAMWRDSVGGNFKYVMLAPSSTVKGQSDMMKFEKARNLKNHIQHIQESYRKDFKSSDMHVAQRAVAMYFIDKLALRVGNEKSSDEADTVGCCSLRVEHLTLLPNNIVKFDFLGKDSIRYVNEVEVLPEVYGLLGKFMRHKKPGDDIFDRLNPTQLNDHLKSFMDGLSAKVFRTYNASVTLDKWFKEKPVNPKASLADKLAYFNKANTEVAILCNHQKSVSKNFRAQMAQLTQKSQYTKDIIALLEKARDTAKKKDVQVAAKEFFEKIDAMQWDWLNAYGTEEEKEEYKNAVAQRGAPKVRSSSSKSKSSKTKSKSSSSSKKSVSTKKKSTAAKKSSAKKTKATPKKKTASKKSVKKEDSSDDETLHDIAKKGKATKGKKRARDEDSEEDVPLSALANCLFFFAYLQGNTCSILFYVSLDKLFRTGSLARRVVGF